MKVFKTIASLAVAFFVTAGSASAATLISHYKLDEASGNTATDSVNSNDGTWQNGTAVNLSRPGGIIGLSADLTDSGNNNFFRISSINQLNGANGVSLSAWVDPDAQTGGDGYNGIFMTRDFNNKNNNSWGLAIENGGGEHLDSRVDGPGIDSPGGSLSPGNGWHHVALTYDAATKTHRQYINGVQTNSTSVAGDADLGAVINGASNGPWHIGFDNCCNSREFDGRIDDVSAWAGALSASEVASLYKNGLQQADASQALGFVATTAGSVQDGLVGHWAMDQVAGTQHAGEAINGNIATLTNMDPNTDWVAGQIGNALQFKPGGSADQQAIVGGAEAAALNSVLNGVTELTMSVWVRSEGSNENNEGIFEHRGPGNSNLTGFNTPGTGAGNVNGDIQFRINSNGITSGGDLINTDEWTLLTGVWESGVRQELYVNGVLVASDATPLGGSLVAAGDWRFGDDLCCGNRVFDGSIDDAGIWTRALSASEVQALFREGLQGINLANAVADVPEPTTALALGLGGLALLRRRRVAA